MQTFMPYSDFKQVAKCLDYRRLGKQRVEAWQIYLTLIKIRCREELLILKSKRKLEEDEENKLLSLEEIGWENHPIVKMWKGYEGGLCYYGICMCNEWKARGYKDTLTAKFLTGLSSFDNNKIPTWVFDEKVHKSHQSNLVRKDSEHYKKLFPDIPDNIPYKWVV